MRFARCITSLAIAILGSNRSEGSPSGSYERRIQPVCHTSGALLILEALEARKFPQPSRGRAFRDGFAFFLLGAQCALSRLESSTNPVLSPRVAAGLSLQSRRRAF